MSSDQKCAGRRAATGASQRGGGKIKALFFTAILGAAIYCAIKVVPIYFAEYQLSDKMQEQARFAIANRYNEDQVKNKVFEAIQDLEIPAKKEDIKVTVTPAIVKISLEYTVPVDLFFYHTDLHFNPTSENKSLT